MKTSRAHTEGGSTRWRNPPGPPSHLEEPREPSTNWSYGSWKTRTGEFQRSWDTDLRTLHWNQSTCHHVEDGHAAAAHGPRAEHAGQQNTAKDVLTSWENPKKPKASQCGDQETATNAQALERWPPRSKTLATGGPSGGTPQNPCSARSPQQPSLSQST